MAKDNNDQDMWYEEFVAHIKSNLLPCINISYTGEPFYIVPQKADRNIILLFNSECPEPGMYYLFLAGVLVYIGVSKRNVYNRILSHFDDKIFDSYFVFRVQDDGIINKCLLSKVLLAESYLIKHFRPLYNKITPLALKQVKMADNKFAD